MGKDLMECRAIMKKQNSYWVVVRVGRRWGKVDLVSFLSQTLVSSKAEAKRLIDQGAIEIGIILKGWE